MKKAHQHLFPKNLSSRTTYTPRPAGGGSKPAFKEGLVRDVHGKSLQSNLKTVIASQKELLCNNNKVEEVLYTVTFDGFIGYSVAVDRLASGGIELLNIQNIESEDEPESYFERVTVAIPKNCLQSFENKIARYLDASKDSRNNKPANQTLIQSIKDLKSTSLKDLWADDIDLYPHDDKEYWFEVWLENDEARLEQFIKLAKDQELEVQENHLKFPERVVLLIRCSLSDLAESLRLQSYIVSFRRTKETAFFFDELEPIDQREWSNELKSRCKYIDNKNNVICLLDTGVNYAHPLLTSIMDDKDQMFLSPIKDGADDSGHGTRMAGIVAYGDLTEALDSQDQIFVNSGIESVKILESSSGNNDKNHGLITIDAVAISEITHPERQRLFVMPITTDAPEHGRPTAWSSAIDSLCSDAMGGDFKSSRLFILSAGNITHRVGWKFNYPESNELEEVFNPGQAWNALTVGAITHKLNIEECTSYAAVAGLGQLSPFSSTTASETWDSDMPLKPEIVFEGGNCGADQIQNWELTSLSLLTTHHDFLNREYTTINATSASAALAANFASKILNRYPAIWAETLRALMVHSAEWNSYLFRQFGQDAILANGEYSASLSKRRLAAKRLRERVGFGKPNLQKALDSFNNSAVMIIEEEFQPYYEKNSKEIGANMLLVDLPWPKDSLEKIADLGVRLTVTLSYFIEPNPSGQAFGKYTYPSHQLRFDINRPLEGRDNFLRRIDNELRKEAISEGLKLQTPEEDKWLFGIEHRSRGSIHKDIWEGNAIDLSQRECLVIYPTQGWWKTRRALNKYNSKTKVSLVLTLEVIDPDIEVDLYSMLKNKITSKIDNKVSIEI